MDSAFIIIQESIYLIIVFGIFLSFAMIRGKQSLINLILSLYLALLISLQFPFYDSVLSGVTSDRMSDSIIMIIIFVAFTILGTFIFGKLMPQEYGETAFESFGKKILFALMASILVMVYSYHALPVTEIYTPGSPVQALFAPEQNFFWWLLVPLLGLLFL